MAGPDAQTVFEVTPDSGLDPVAAVRACIEAGHRSLLFAEGALPDAFFDLRTGMAGEVVQALVNYSLRMAAVVPAVDAHGARFAEFAGEANRGHRFRFCPDPGQARAWLAGPR